MDLCDSESVVQGNLERKDSLEIHNRSHTKLFQEEKTAKSVERDVMVENVSSTTGYGSQKTPEKQQESKMYQSKEKRMLEVLHGLSKKLKEKTDMTSGKSFTESKLKSHGSKKSSGKEKSVKREHSGSESASGRKLGLKDNTNKDYERETKRAKPEVSSSSLVLAARKHGVPISQRLSYQPGDVREPSDMRVSKTDRLARKDSNKYKSKQKFVKHNDQATKQKKYERDDSASHHNKMDISINYEEMVEREVRKIRKNMEKVNKKTSELEDRSMSQDALTPFLPSSRCCTPPPRPPVAKYWSDADETEEESDCEKHNMHVNSVNIVLNYLKAHSEAYYRKGKEPDSRDSDDEVQLRRKIKRRPPFRAQSDFEWNHSKGKFARKLHKSDRGGNLLSRHLSDQEHPGPSGQEDESLVRDYDCHLRPQFPLSGLAGKVKLLASMSLKYLLSNSSLTHGQGGGGKLLSPPDHNRSPSPLHSQEMRATQQRSLYSPLRHEDGRNRHKHSRHDDDESYSPWHKRRSLTRESASPFGHSDLLKNSQSHSSSRYQDESLRERELFSSSRYRHDFQSDRDSLSPARDRHNSPWAKESYSPSRYRNNSARDRVSHSPSRHRHNSLRDRGSYSPSRYKGNSWRESYSPSRYRRDSLRDRNSYSPSRCSSDSWRERVLHSPSRYTDNSMRDRTSCSPPRSRGDSWRERRLREEGSLRRAETPGLRNTEFSSSSQRCSLQRSPEHYSFGAQLPEPHFSEGLRHKDQFNSPSYRDRSRSPLRLYSRRSELDFKRQRSRSSEKDVSPRRYKSIKHDGNRLSPEFSKRSQSPRNLGRLSRRDRSQSITSNTGRQEKKKKNIGNDYFFNPALENTYEEYQQNSKPYIPQNQIQEGERHSAEGRSLSSNSVAFRDIRTQGSLYDRSYINLDQIKHQSYDLIKGENFTSKIQTQITTLHDKEADQPKDCVRVSNIGLAYQQPCLPDVHDKQLQRNITEPNKPLATQENLPGPSGISSMTAMGGKDMDDLPDWLNDDSDINYDLEDLNGPLSEVSSLIADHKAATADKTYSDTGSASAVPMEQKIVTTENCREGTEKANLGLSTSEMNTFLRLIEIAKEHSATSKSLGNVSSILEKICQSTTSKSVSDLLGGLSGGEKKLSGHISQVSGGMQDNTHNAGSSGSSTCSGNNENYTESSKRQRDDQGVAPFSNKEKNHLPKDKASESNTAKKLPEIKKGCKLQQSKSKLQVGVAYNKLPGGKDLSESTSKPQQRKDKLQMKKAIDKPSKREETYIQSMKKGKCNGLQQNRGKIKEELLKEKEDVKETPYKINLACKSQEKREMIGSKKSEIEKTFANMLHVRIYVEDVSQSGTRKPYKGGRGTLLTSPKTTSPKQVGERPLSLDNSDFRVDSESPEAMKVKDSQLSSYSSAQVHPLHQKTIVLKHSVNICLACKHKLVLDEFTSMFLSTGVVTMRCRNCHTFTKMKTALKNDITKELDAQKSNLLKKSCDKICSTTSVTSLKSHSDFSSEASVMKHVNILGRSLDSNTHIMKGGDFSQSVEGELPVGGRVASKNTSSSRMSQEDNDSKHKKSMERRQEPSNNISTIDPSLLVYPWSSSRKRKKIYGDIKVNDSSSDSDEEYVTKKQHQKRPVKKRRRILNNPSTSGSSDD